MTPGGTAILAMTPSRQFLLSRLPRGGTALLRMTYMLHFGICLLVVIYYCALWY